MRNNLPRFFLGALLALVSIPGSGIASTKNTAEEQKKDLLYKHNYFVCQKACSQPFTPCMKACYPRNDVCKSKCATALAKCNGGCGPTPEEYFKGRKKK